MLTEEALDELGDGTTVLVESPELLPFGVTRVRLKPVPTGSIMTMSVLSSSVAGLSTMLYGAGEAWSVPGVVTRFGPMTPMWSQNDDEPGPPLYENMTGRRLLSATPVRTYAV